MKLGLMPARLSDASSITLPAQLVVGWQSNWGLDAVSGLQDWTEVSLCDHAEAVPFGSQAAQGPRRVRW